MALRPDGFVGQDKVDEEIINFKTDITTCICNIQNIKVSDKIKISIENVEIIEKDSSNTIYGIVVDEIPNGIIFADKITPALIRLVWSEEKGLLTSTKYLHNCPYEFGDKIKISVEIITSFS